MDLTEGGLGVVKRKNVSSILQNHEKTVVALLESAAQALLGADREGRIVLANARAEEMFGYTIDELRGAAIEVLLPDSLRKAHSDHRAEYFAHPRVRPMGIGMDLLARRKDGSEFPVEISLSYVQTDEGLFAIAFVSDISHRKQLEDQLIQARKMEAIGRLAGGVAHDFNNMLTIVSGYSRMIADRLPAGDPLRAYSEEVLKAADRASALTSQLLAFSRRQITKPRVIDTNVLLSNIEKMLHRLIGEDIELKFSLEPAVAHIKVDPGQLEQVIFNLAANSRDALPRGGRITIETKGVRLDSAYAQTHLDVKPGNYVMIAVTDNGEGMDEVTRRRIFEPFFTTKAQGKGTGLGLATAFGIVKQAGGDIWVYSEPGKGTTFKLYFPAASDSPVEQPVPAPARTAYRGNETILVVEDDDSVRDLMITMLQGLGYHVLSAGSVDEAIAVRGDHPGKIALLVTDVVMPEKGGKQLADALSLATPDLKILYLSGYTEGTVMRHGVLDPGVDFLAKPFNQEDLGKKVREVLDKR
ncbi:MAG TPA: ATP-binding protein [Bryobacteraceae bacterium]|nr:ATP-binding protein [Bryobacteraceae bacterium]